MEKLDSPFPASWVKSKGVLYKGWILRFFLFLSPYRDMQVIPDSEASIDLYMLLF